MKKLYSYLMYVWFIVSPIGFIFFAISINRHYEFTIKYFLSNDLIVVILLFLIFYTYIKYKRVYLKNSSLYIYNLFSNKYAVVTKQNLVSIGRFIPFEPFSYKISYIDENNNTKTIYFMKNLFIFNMQEALNDLK